MEKNVLTVAKIWHLFQPFVARDKYSNICSLVFIAAHFRREIAHSTKALPSKKKNNNNNEQNEKKKKKKNTKSGERSMHTYLHASRAVFQGEESPNKKKNTRLFDVLNKTKRVVS